MIHPATELRFVSEVMGYGVFATQFIPKGTITWVHDDLDQSFRLDQIQRMEEPYRRILEKYTFVDGSGQAILCWDHSRFINHSCNPNCLSAGYDFELAVRDIQAGEELTDDYGTLNLQTPFSCACQSPQCRQEISGADAQQLADAWDLVVRPVFPLIPQVSQPLWFYVREKAELEKALKHPELIRSIRSNLLSA